MKKIFFIFYMFCNYSYSQNWINVTSQYITNPSFEDYTSCPQAPSQPSNYWLDSCIGWTVATYATPDYLNACANSSYTQVGVPNNFTMGNQLAYHGNAYCGFLANSYGSTTGGMWCEYLETTVKNNFIAGNSYRLTMRLIPSKHNFYGVSKIGVHFSTSKLAIGFKETSFKFPPTLLNSKGIIADTTKWFLFDEKFTAIGNENVITIGWFCDTLTNDNGYYDTTVSQVIYGDVYYAIDSLNILELQNEEFNFNDFNINIITPNNDGVNDEISFTKYNLKELEFEVYNRWGHLVFKTNSVKASWNGLNNESQPLNDGTYYYIINAITKNNDKIKKHNFLSINR